MQQLEHSERVLAILTFSEHVEYEDQLAVLVAHEDGVGAKVFLLEVRDGQGRRETANEGVGAIQTPV